MTGNALVLSVTKLSVAKKYNFQLDEIYLRSSMQGQVLTEIEKQFFKTNSPGKGSINATLRVLRTSVASRICYEAHHQIIHFL